MRFGIKTAPQHCIWQDILDVWRAADEIDLFESAWNFDHFYPLVGDPEGTCMEAWVTLTALAANTRRIRIGCMVNAVPYRHPALTANMAASLDIVSDGRLDLGFGAGWHEEEGLAYGIDLKPMRQRMDRFEEAVEVVKMLLTREQSSYSGEHYQLTEARCEPKGPQGCPPVVIGGGGEKRTLRVVARFADHWNLTSATPETFQAKHDVLAGHCERVGRNINDIACSVQIALPANKDPQPYAEQAAVLGEAGVDVVIFSMRTPYHCEALEPLAKALQAVS